MSGSEIELDFRASQIHISLDERGAPRITGEDLVDVIHGLGFCHAHNRGMQMLLVRTLGRGEASKYLGGGKELFQLDLFFRRLNLPADFASEYQALTNQARGLIDAYCDGVNRYFTSHKTPWELRLAGTPSRPPTWTFDDVYLTGKVIGYPGLAQTQADLETWIVQCVQNGVPLCSLARAFPHRPRWNG